VKEFLSETLKSPA